MLIDRNGEVQLKNWGKPSCLALSPNGKTAALGFPAGHIAIFDLESSREIAKRDWQRGPVTTVTFVDDQHIALAAAGQLRVWHWSSDTATPAPIDFPGTLKALAPDASGQRLAAASSDSLHLIDIATGLRIASQLAVPEDVTTLIWDERLHVFSSQSETKVLQTPPLKSELTPDQAESLIGMKVDAEDRVVRLGATATLEPAGPAVTSDDRAASPTAKPCPPGTLPCCLPPSSNAITPPCPACSSSTTSVNCSMTSPRWCARP
jgi:WD40 repeat protein